jgi:hypothetical protein
MSGKERKGKGRGEGDGSKKRACRLGKEAMDGGRKTEMKTDWKDDITKVRRGGGRDIRVKEVRERA